MNNPPAFPKLPIGRASNNEILYQSDGMTLRDYFAAKAMQGYCSNQQHTSSCTVELTADCAYEMADAMLAEREKT